MVGSPRALLKIENGKGETKWNLFSFLGFHFYERETKLVDMPLGDGEGVQASFKRVVILAAPADINYDLGTKISYKEYLKVI